MIAAAITTSADNHTKAVCFMILSLRHQYTIAADRQSPLGVVDESVQRYVRSLIFATAKGTSISSGLRPPCMPSSLNLS